MGDFAKRTLSRRAVLGAGAAAAGLLAMPAVLRAQDKSLKVGVYGGYFKDSFDKNIFPGFHQGDRHRRGIGGRADRRGLAGAARAGRQGGPGAGRRLDDVADVDAEGPVDRAVDADRHERRSRTTATCSSASSTKYPDGRVAGIGAVAWYITLVTNTDVYPGARRPPGRPSGIRPMPTSSACSRSSPTPSCSKSRPRPSWAAPTRSTPRKAC